MVCRDVAAGIGRLVAVDADALAQRVGRVQDADAEREAHDEAADVREVVQAGEQAEHEGDCDVEQDEEQVFDGRAALAPSVEDVEEDECYDAEERAGCAAVMIEGELEERDMDEVTMETW